MKETYYWILLGMAAGTAIYLLDKYLFLILRAAKFTNITDYITYFQKYLKLDLKFH